jgi:diphthine synthase
VGLLIPGDPLVATTHVDLLIQARKMGIKTKVIHAPSIYSALGETGLFIYKFGKTTTIPFPEKGYEPESPYDTIKENKERGLHTLCLLDVKDKLMTPKEGMEYLLEIEKKRKEKVLDREDMVIVFVSRERGNTAYDKVENLMKRKFQTPAVLIIPGTLHSIEKEALL